MTFRVQICYALLYLIILKRGVILKYPPDEKGIGTQCLNRSYLLAAKPLHRVLAYRVQKEESIMRYRPEYDMKVIGQNLKRLREAKKLSVDEVREYLCLGSVQAVYKYEKGKSYPQADTMFALMELYEADLYDIVTNYEEGAQPSSAVSGGSDRIAA